MTSAQIVHALATHARIDPYAAAILIGVPILSVERVSAVRCEYQLGANAQFHDVTAVVGGRDERWRVLDLVPRDLMLEPLCALMPADAPHLKQPLVKHTNDGPVLVGIEHRFVVVAGELVIATRDARIVRVTLMAQG